MAKGKRKLRFGRLIVMILFVVIVGVISLTFFSNNKVYMANLNHYSVDQITNYAQTNHLKLNIKYEYSKKKAKNQIISQNIKENTLLKKQQPLNVVISLGNIPISIYNKYHVNELGNVPIMMYHGIHDIPIGTNVYPGGNIDKDGYNRTANAFKNDLEMYYHDGYRMIRLQDYINGNIKVALGKSPIVLTFDDGGIDNIRILGKDSKGNLQIDPNCAVGILEHFKKKYPDFHVTATFFLNDGLFGQPKYNNDILKWLVANGYDVGNHTKTHINFKDASQAETITNIGYMYKLFDSIIPKQYVHIVALPFGSPFKKDHPNFPYILDGNDNGYKYHTDATLRVGWDPNPSPFSINFDKTFMKRVRAWDNNGKEYDIAMTFKLLKTTKYISSVINGK